MTQLMIFPTPSNAACVLKTDHGDVITGHPAIHPTGRPGVGFDIPDGHPNGWGARLTITAEWFVPLDLRGVLMLTGPLASFFADDFTLQKAGTRLPRLIVQGTSFVQDVEP